MKKLFKLTVFTFFIFLCSLINTKALTSSEYAGRKVCPKFELARAESNGNATKIECYNDYNSAKNAMNSSNEKNLFIFEVGSSTKIVDAKYALVDLSATGPDLTYFYTSKDLKYAYTYMDTGSLYGGVDGALLDVNYGKSIKVKVAAVSAWIPNNTFELVPLPWVKSSATYTISDNIKHNYVNKIQETYSGNKGSVIGPKPDGIAKGTYYSYDGHYFYTDRYNMIDDYKNNNYSHAINANNPYYNYYMYLSNHSKTTYSAINIDEYIRNNMGVSKALYGDKSVDNSSRLYGQGTFFYNTQEQHGNNALLAFSHSRNETGHGRSSIAIKKNNGFGLNAVDSNPGEAAGWFPTFASSIYEFGRDWVTNGYADPDDWRYFGPVFGDKLIGMNVKYASGPYWSETMASLYYDFDRAYGMQDYNYYQLGVVTKATNAYLYSNGTGLAYTYPEAEDGVLIVGEEGNYYKVQSDKIINGTTITTVGKYNWNSYVYVLKSDVKKINTSKNGYKYPSDVTNYKDKDYTYDLYVRNATLMPKVAITQKNLKYYYDSTLDRSTGKTVLKDKWLMVYAEAFDKDGNTVAYLVTSDYKFDQKHWIPAGGIRFQTTGYGKVTVNVFGAYTWVNSTPHERSDTIIGGQYNYSYVPLLTSTTSDGKAWYKVPVSLTSNDNSYGWTIAQDSEVSIQLIMYNADSDNARLNTVVNSAPTISTGGDTTIYLGSTFNKLEGVSATDKEDGDLTNNIVVTGDVDANTVGTYTLTYTVTDSKGSSTSAVRNITVIKNEEPIINVNNKVIKQNSNFNKLEGVSATDKEDGDLTNSIIVIGEVDTTTIGIYTLTYKVIDSYNNTTEKEITVEVISEEEYLEINPREEKEATFYLDALKPNNNEIMIKGYNAIKGINNTLEEDITYKIVFVNQNTNEEIETSLNRITNESEMTRPVYRTDNLDYTYSWFKGNIDINDIPDGDYYAYIISQTDEYFAKTILSDKVFKSQITNFNNGNKYLTTRNNYMSSNIELEFIIRSEKLANKNSNIYNAYNQYRELEFKNDLLHIKGTSYSYGMDLSLMANLDRKIIFENIDSYSRYSYDLGAISNGLYTVGTTLGDNLAKDKAWFDASIDISNIKKGRYAIYIVNKANVEDYGELTEVLLRNLDDVILNKNGKKYSFSINNSLRYRIELNVE